ncbi:hypothetical protein ACTA71_000513 [Dictyostelium dimigraforme]
MCESSSSSFKKKRLYSYSGPLSMVVKDYTTVFIINTQDQQNGIMPPEKWMEEMEILALFKFIYNNNVRVVTKVINRSDQTDCVLSILFSPTLAILTQIYSTVAVHRCEIKFKFNQSNIKEFWKEIQKDKVLTI